MLEMTAEHLEYVAFALFVASELIGMNPKLRSNSVLQLLVSAGMRAFPYRGRRDR